jgi:DNA-binding NarL/FixJ family response regulator
MSLSSSLLEASLYNVPTGPIMRVLLIDDDQFICAAIAGYIERMASKITKQPIAMTPAFTLAEGIAAVSAPDHPDRVFLDLTLRGESCGIETLERFQRGNCYNVPVTIFTGLSLEQGDDALETLRKCFVLGAKGILLKTADLDSMFRGLGRILVDGDFWAPEPVLRALATTPPSPAESLDRHGLTPREWQIAKAITRGLQNKEIGQELGISYQHVAQVTKQIFHKLRVRNRTQAALVMAEARRH